MTTTHAGAQRLQQMPPYLFAQIEEKIASMKADGIDVISLGIGDPDRKTPARVITTLASAAADPSTHRYPSNRGRLSFRDAVARFYERRFGVTLDPATEIIPALGAKEAVANLNLAFLDPGDIALSADPGYPVYTTGPILAGARAYPMPLRPDRAFQPDLDAIPAEVAAKARLMWINYPNNPTGAVIEDDFFARVVAFAKEHDVIVIHDNAYSELTYDGYVAPSFLETPGAMDIGLEVFSLSKPWNMTGWRVAAVVGNSDLADIYWRLKTNIDSGMFEAVQEAGATALCDCDALVEEMRGVYTRRRDTLCEAMTAIGLEVTPPKGTIYIWAPVPEGHDSRSFTERVLDEAHVVISPGSAFGAAGEGFVRMSLTLEDDRLDEAAERIAKLL